MREYEPDLSDEALENMVPPPKRRIGEDTPLVDVTQRQYPDYSLANYARDGNDEEDEMGLDHHHPIMEEKLRRPPLNLDDLNENNQMGAAPAKPPVDLKAKMMLAKQKSPRKLHPVQVA